MTLTKIERSIFMTLKRVAFMLNTSDSQVPSTVTSARQPPESFTNDAVISPNWRNHGVTPFSFIGDVRIVLARKKPLNP